MTTSVADTPPDLRTELFETAGDRRWDEVVTELGEIAGQLNSLFGRVTEIAAAVDDEDLLAGTGVSSLPQFLAWQLGLSQGRARELAKIASRRSELPAVTELLDDGLLSVDQVAPIAARLPGDPAADRHFAELAQHLTVANIRKAVQATIPVDETPRDDDGPTSPSPREMSFGHRDDGTWTARVRAGTADGGLFEAGLRSHLDALWLEHKTLVATLGDDREPPPPPTWYDAFVRMVDRSLEREATDRPHSQRTKVLVHVRAGHDLAQLHLGPALTAAERALLTCDASIATVLEDRGTPVSCGREHRIVPDRTRMIVEHRDGGCAVPWCGATKYLVVHHIIHWEHGGPTDTHNLICLCPFHHRAVHADLLDVTGNADRPDELVITHRKRRRITGRTAARSPDEAIPPAPNTYQAAWGRGVSWRDWIPPHIYTAT